MHDNSAHTRPRFLVVEDEVDIASLIMLHLADLDAEVRVCDRGDTALAQALQEQWSLILLDIRLPGMNGLDICKALRERGVVTPILMLTSKSSELDRVLGLELGADDYLTKPFSPIELLARVKALLRRAGLTQPTPAIAVEPQTIRLGPLRICTREHRVQRDGHDVDLTSKEFDLLLHFVRHPGQVFRRSELLDTVWGYGHDGYEHTVNSHINRLRSKIETDPSSPEFIVTVWGVGYKFDQSGQTTQPRSGAV
ncbi:MAG: response regulator transcription factor [Pseudomonadota bacterium]